MAWANHRFADNREWLQRAVARLIAAGLMMFSISAIGQRSYFRIYDQDYGLDVGEIVALAQDNDGFLWIGSHRGLVRFDGRNFVLWGQDQVDEVVSQIIHDADDELLIRTATGGNDAFTRLFANVRQSTGRRRRSVRPGCRRSSRPVPPDDRRSRLRSRRVCRRRANRDRRNPVRAPH